MDVVSALDPSVVAVAAVLVSAALAVAHTDVTVKSTVAAVAPLVVASTVGVVATQEIAVESAVATVESTVVAVATLEVAVTILQSKLIKISKQQDMMSMKY